MKKICRLVPATGKKLPIVRTATYTQGGCGRWAPALRARVMPAALYEAYDSAIVTDEGKTKGVVEGMHPEQIEVSPKVWRGQAMLPLPPPA